MKVQTVITEDDLHVNGVLKYIAQRTDLEVTTFFSAEEFLAHPLKASIYMIDWNLPGLVGPEIIKHIRSKDKLCTIFLISGRRDLSDHHTAFAAGADHYIIKPFNTQFLISKLENAKTKTLMVDQVHVDKGFKIFAEASMISYNGLSVRLSPAEFKTFRRLLNSHDRTICIKDFSEILNEDSNLQRGMTIIIYSLRKKISVLNLEIKSLRNHGYRLIEKTIDNQK